VCAYAHVENINFPSSIAALLAAFAVQVTSIHRRDRCTSWNALELDVRDRCRHGHVSSRDELGRESAEMLRVVWRAYRCGTANSGRN
jgi:hypothetical protein